ncbi:MAG: hypothetical protein AAFO72_08550 [Pseudomonadota bacterium]
MRGSLKFLSVKGVPVLFWSSPKALTMTPRLVSLLFLVVGLTLFGLGEALLIAAGVGVSPWTVLAEGITYVTGWSIGFATFVVSVAVLLCWIPLRQVPGIGTILNVIIIALVIEYALPYLPTFETVALQVAQSMAGVLITGFGGALYLIANLGPGPRDGLMTGLQAVTNWPIAWVRSALEVSVVVIGWFLGGTVGVGTVLFAFGIGPAVAGSMYGLQALFDREESRTG